MSSERMFGRTPKEIKHTLFDPRNKPPLWFWFVFSFLVGGAFLTADKPVFRVRALLVLGIGLVIFGIYVWIDKKISFERRVRRERCEE